MIFIWELNICLRKNESDYLVRVGYTGNSHDKPKYHKIKKIIIHPRYDEDTHDADISLLEV